MTMEDEKIRVGMVGLGNHGRTIQRATAEAGNLDVRTVFDIVDSEAESAAERFGCERAASFDELLKRDDLEAVILVTPNHLHRPQAEAAFRAGLDVFVEKPIANTVSDAAAMARAADHAGRVLMVGHNMRRSRPARMVKKILDDGRLGEVVTAEIHYSSDTGMRLKEDSWRIEPSRCPLVPVMQLGIHAIDLIHYFLGPITAVDARARSVAVRSGVLDSVVSTFETETGMLGTIVCNYCTQVSFEFRLAGTDASVWGTPYRLSYRRTSDTDGYGEGPSEERDFRVHELESYILQMHEFGESVRTRKPPETGGREALRALAVVEAMHRSVRTGRTEMVAVLQES